MPNNSTGSTESSCFEEYSFAEITVESRSSSYTEVSVADDESDVVGENSMSQSSQEELVSSGGSAQGTLRKRASGSNSTTIGMDVGSPIHPGLNNGFNQENMIQCPSTPGFDLTLRRPQLIREVSNLTECLKSPMLEATSRPTLKEFYVPHDVRRPTFSRQMSELSTEWPHPSRPSSLADESSSHTENKDSSKRTLMVPQFIRQASGLSIASSSVESTEDSGGRQAEAPGYDLILPCLPRQLSGLTLTDGFDSRPTSEFYSGKSPTRTVKPSLRRMSQADAFASRFNGRVMPKQAHHVNSFTKWSHHNTGSRPNSMTRLSSVSEGPALATPKKEESLPNEKLAIKKKRPSQLTVKDSKIPSGPVPAKGTQCKKASRPKNVSQDAGKKKQGRRNSCSDFKSKEKARRQRRSSTTSVVGKRESTVSPPPLRLHKKATPRESTRSPPRVSAAPYRKRGSNSSHSGSTRTRTDKNSLKISSNNGDQRRERKVDTSSKERIKQPNKEQGGWKKDPPGVRLKYVPSLRSGSSSRGTRSTADLSQSSSGWWSLSNEPSIPRISKRVGKSRTSARRSTSKNSCMVVG